MPINRSRGQDAIIQKNMGNLLVEVLANADLKNRLKADPKAMLIEYGLPGAEGGEVKVVENGPKVASPLTPYPNFGFRLDGNFDDSDPIES